MGFSSLPKYPTPQRRVSIVRRWGMSLGLSPRLARIVFDVALLVIIITVVSYWLWLARDAFDSPPVPAPPPPPLLDFKLIEERFGDVPMFAGREEVEALLGPPTERVAFDPELREAIIWSEHKYRHVGLPGERYWEKWSDPRDKGRWVAVLYAGPYPKEKVYDKFKKGF